MQWQCRRDSFPSVLLLLLQQILLAGNRHRLEDQLAFIPNDEKCSTGFSALIFHGGIHNSHLAHLEAKEQSYLSREKTNI